MLLLYNYAVMSTTLHYREHVEGEIHLLPDRGSLFIEFQY